MTQIEALLKLLNDSKVRYLIIGAAALAAHGWTRATQDIDLYVANDNENLKRLINALQTFGYDTTDATLEDFRKYKILFRQYDLPLDIHPHVSGSDHFESAWSQKFSAKIGKIETNFVSLEDLLKMKKAANREKDQKDIEQLEKLKKAQKIKTS